MLYDCFYKIQKQAKLSNIYRSCNSGFSQHRWVLWAFAENILYLDLGYGYRDGNIVLCHLSVLKHFSVYMLFLKQILKGGKNTSMEI